MKDAKGLVSFLQTRAKEGYESLTLKFTLIALCFQVQNLYSLTSIPQPRKDEKLAKIRSRKADFIEK